MREPLHLLLDRLQTPIGEMLIVTDDADHLRATDWTDYESRLQRLFRLHYGERGYRLESSPRPLPVTDTLRRYFAGETSIIDTLPVKTGGTAFQRLVWQALRQIPCGTTVSYAQIAEQIGHPRAVRAVGLANGANPVGVVVPCHRVVGANGSLTGYGGGMHRKAWLLQHESAAGPGRWRDAAELPLFSQP